MIALTYPPGSPYAQLAPAEFGLVAAAGINALLGKSGALLLLIVLFLAVTSAASSELVAVSSILTYDVYRRYVNPHATDKQVMFWTHAACIFYGIWMGLLGVIFYYIGINLGWLFGFTAVWASGKLAWLRCIMIRSNKAHSGSVMPVAFALRVRRCNKWFCLAGIVVGFAAGVGSWLGVAKAYYGSTSVTATGGEYAQLAGAGTALVVSSILCFTGVYFANEDYDFDVRKNKEQRKGKAAD